jgi:hypothetical protein
MRTLVLAFTLLAIAAPTARAQNESALRAALEGKNVVVKIDMPGTSKGIDVFPNEQNPVNWREVADRVKANGTALRIGQPVMITKVVVNKNSHIEVQLGGGGYGTFGDETGPAVIASDEGESKLERLMRDSIKTAATPAIKKRLEKDLDNLRDERQRRNERARISAARANEAREANIRTRRLDGGSRFNVRYRNGMPPEALTPASVMAALAEYVDFSGAAPGSAPAPRAVGATPENGKSLVSLRKGLLLTDVEALLGPANTASESKEGILTLVKRTYVSEGNRVTAYFVNGVLIDFTIAPQ